MLKSYFEVFFQRLFSKIFSPGKCNNGDHWLEVSQKKVFQMESCSLLPGSIYMTISDVVEFEYLSAGKHQREFVKSVIQITAFRLSYSIVFLMMKKISKFWNNMLRDLLGGHSTTRTRVLVTVVKIWDSNKLGFPKYIEIYLRIKTSIISIKHYKKEYLEASRRLWQLKMGQCLGKIMKLRNQAQEFSKILIFCPKIAAGVINFGQI